MTRAAFLRAAVVGAMLGGVLGGCYARSDSSAPSELDHYLDALSPRPSAQQVDDDWLRVERGVAECMARNGIAYHPAMLARERAAALGLAVPAGEPEVGSRDFAQEHGFGAASGYFERRASVHPTPAEQIDPSWRAVLAGTDGTGANANGEHSGCWHEATRAAAAVKPTTTPTASVATVLAQARAARDGAAKTPEVAAAQAAWSSCMRKSGFAGFADRDTMVDFFYARAARAQLGHQGGDPRLLDDLADIERATALADIDCRGEVGFDDQLRAAVARADAQFVSKHRAELESALAQVPASPQADNPIVTMTVSPPAASAPALSSPSPDASLTPTPKPSTSTPGPSDPATDRPTISPDPSAAPDESPAPSTSPVPSPTVPPSPPVAPTEAPPTPTPPADTLTPPPTPATDPDPGSAGNRGVMPTDLTGGSSATPSE